MTTIERSLATLKTWLQLEIQECGSLVADAVREHTRAWQQLERAAERHRGASNGARDSVARSMVYPELLLAQHRLQFREALALEMANREVGRTTRAEQAARGTLSDVLLRQKGIERAQLVQRARIELAKSLADASRLDEMWLARAEAKRRYG